MMPSSYIALNDQNSWQLRLYNHVKINVKLIKSYKSTVYGKYYYGDL